MQPRHRLSLGSLLFTVAALAPLGSSGCRRDVDIDSLKSMSLDASARRASPTNAQADDPAAASLGRSLFFEKRLSSDGTIACASCHDPSSGFSDPKPLSVGVRGQLGDRHAMPIVSSTFMPFLMWDGRADSPWSQPLLALENPKEMDFTRLEVVRLVSTDYGAEYAAVFGALPDLSTLPARGRPGLEGWESLPVDARVDVERVFSNVGKAIEAYERKLACSDTRFDRWARGELELSERELDGASVFVREGCVGCHAGPTFSDGAFHNLGLPSTDPGRRDGRAALMASAFNGAGAYSDDPAAGTAALAAASSEGVVDGAFRTASLRGVGQRRFFGHLGQQETLEAFLTFAYRNPDRRTPMVGAIDPKLARVDLRDGDVGDVAAFLRTLDCPHLSPDLDAP